MTSTSPDAVDVDTTLNAGPMVMVGPETLPKLNEWS